MTRMNTIERSQVEKDDLLYNGVLIYSDERSNIIDWLREYDIASDDEFVFGDDQYDRILGRAADYLIAERKEFKTTELSSDVIDDVLARAKSDQ